MKISYYSKHRIKPHGTTHLRCTQPADLFRSMGHHVRVDTIYRSIPRRGELIVLHRAAWDKYTQAFVRYARSIGCTLVYDVDDLLFEAEAEVYLSKIGKKGKRYQHEWFSACMKQMDAITVSTSYLLERASTLHDHVSQLNNFIANAFENTANEVASGKDRDAGQRICLGYLSGSSSHDADFKLITPALLKMLKKHEQLQLLIVGPLQLDAAFDQYNHRIERRDFVPYDRLPTVYAEVDVNLTPLEVEEAFCQAKSELKYIEAGICGVPTVASPTQPYQDFIKDGVNGLLASDEQWEKKLTSLVEHPVRIHALGMAARKAVQDSSTETQRKIDLQNWLQDLPKRSSTSLGNPIAYCNLLRMKVLRNLKRKALRKPS